MSLCPENKFENLNYLCLPDERHIVLNFQLNDEEPCIFITDKAIGKICVYISLVRNECMIAVYEKCLMLKREYGTMSEMCTVICNFTAQRVRSDSLDELIVTTNFGYLQCVATKSNIIEVITPIVQCLLFTRKRSMLKDEDVRAEQEVKLLRRQPALTKSSRGKPINSESCTLQ